MSITLEWGLLPLLKASLFTSAVILPVLLFSRYLNRRYAAGWKYWLWLLLALRLLLPVELNLSQPPVMVPVPEGAQELFQGQVLVLGDDSEETLPSSGNPGEVGMPAPVEQVPASRAALTGEEVLKILWAGGAAGFFLWQYLAHRSFRRRVLAVSRPADREQQALLKETASELGIRRVPGLRVSRKAPGPLVIGLLCPVLVLPGAEIPQEELYFIFRHELTHCRRRDVAYKLVLLLANGVHWFNPLAWLMFREAAGDLELSCDAEALRGVSREDRRRYGRAVLESVGRQQIRGTALTTHFASGARALRERLANILDLGKRRRGLLLLGAAVLAAALAGGLVACGDQGGSREEESGSEPAAIRTDPADFLTPADFDEAFLEALDQQWSVTREQGPGAPGGLGPNFLADDSGRVKSYNGEGQMEDGGLVARLLTHEPEKDLLNRERLAAFAQNCHAGVPDQIVILSSGSPVPLWVNIYTSSEDGSYTVERFFRPGGEDLDSTTVPALQETESEWLLVQEEDWKVRYPKYGYEPIPLAVPPREATQEETLTLLEEFVQENDLLSPMTAELLPGEEREIDGLVCGTFRGVTSEGFDSGDMYAVSPDLSQVWEIEQVNGQWLLLARPKANSSQ